MGFWDKDDREPWEEHEEKYPKRNDDEEMFGSSAFKMPMNDFEVKEWEKKLLGNPETILKSSEMGDFVKENNSGMGALRILLLYKMVNAVDTANQMGNRVFKEMFQTSEKICGAPINMSQFLVFGALKTGIVYDKRSKEFFTEQYNKQLKFYAERGEETLVQFLGYVCAGMCIWKNFYKEHKQVIDEEKLKYYKTHKDEFVEKWSEQPEDFMKIIVIDQAELIINDNNIKSEKDIKWD